MDKKSIYQLFLSFILAGSFLAVSHCSKTSEADLIVRSLESIGDYAERKDMDSLMVYISESYSDDEQRTYGQIEDIIRKNMNRFKQIHIRLLNSRVNRINPPLAEVELDISFTPNKVAKVASKYFSGLEEYYRFDLKMIKEDNTWVIKSARWRPIPKRELL